MIGYEKLRHELARKYYSAQDLLLLSQEVRHFQSSSKESRLRGIKIDLAKKLKGEMKSN